MNRDLVAKLARAGNGPSAADVIAPTPAIGFQWHRKDQCDRAIFARQIRHPSFDYQVVRAGQNFGLQIETEIRAAIARKAGEIRTSADISDHEPGGRRRLRVQFLRPSVSPFGFSFGVTDGGGSVLDAKTIALSLDGASLTATAVTKNGATTSISYSAPAPLPSGSSHTAKLTVKDTKGIAYTSSETYVVPAYGTLPTNAALSASAVDKTKKGFRIRTYQTDGGSQDGTIAYNEALLAGLNGPNVANLADAGGVDAGGYFTWTGVINFDTTPTAANGYFNDPDYLDSNFPGIPGTPSTGVDIENFVEEILAALEFKAPGMYTMAVNTDWTGFPNGTDGYLVRAGVDPLAPASSVTLGYFDANAPAGPTRGVANSPFQFYVPQAGTYPFRLMYYQSAGSANLEWFMLNADGSRTLINDTTKADAVPAYYKWTTSAGAPTLSFTRAANGLTLTFTGALQSADKITGGTWADVTGASPLTVPTTGPIKFYRAKQ